LVTEVETTQNEPDLKVEEEIIPKVPDLEVNDSQMFQEKDLME